MAPDDDAPETPEPAAEAADGDQADRYARTADLFDVGVRRL